MTSFPETVNAADSKKKAVTVSTQKNLENALSDSSNTSIRISTKRTTTFTVPQGNYAGVSLVVDAGKATVKNRGTFSKLIIDNGELHRQLSYRASSARGLRRVGLVVRP